MARNLNFAVGVIGLLLISTLSYSHGTSGATLSKTYVTASVDTNPTFTAVTADFSSSFAVVRTQYTFVIVYTAHPTFAILVDNRWEPVVTPKYGKPINSPKPENTTINGILKQKNRWLQFNQSRT